MKRKYRCCLVPVLLLLCGLLGCGSEPSVQEAAAANEFTEETCIQEPEIGETEMKLWVNDEEIPVIWEENETVRALRQQAGEQEITVRMSMYSDNEQVGPLGRSYPRADQQTTTHNGDIVLYSGNQIVVFYGSNSWAYTRLGRMNINEEKVIDLFANGNVTLRISKE